MGESRRVLYVGADRERTTRRAAALADQRDGLVVDAATGEEALGRLADDIDCVVLENAMPEMDGPAILESVRERYPNLPVILTDGSGGGTPTEAIAAGATAYLRGMEESPQWELLAERIEAAVARARESGQTGGESRLRRLARVTGGTGSWELDLETGTVRTTEGTRRLVGRGAGDGLDREGFLEAFHPDDRADVQAVLERAVDRDGETQCRARLGGSGVRRVELRAARVLRDGDPVALLGTVQDITDQDRRERTLETLHTAATEIRDCETIAAACERTVAAAEEILDFEMCSILLAEDGWLEPIALSSGAPPDGVRRVPTDNGLAGKTFQSGESFVVDSVEPDDETDPAKESYRSGMSIPVGEVGVFQAVATEEAAFDTDDLRFGELLVSHTARTVERIRFERELEESRDSLRRQNQRLEAFADIVSHDLRNPLNVATMRLDLAAQESDSDHLEAVEQAHDRMESLIESLLRLAKEGQPVESVESVGLSPLVKQCWQNVATADATLVAETDQPVLADPDRLRQLFENLFRNSVEHSSTSLQSQAPEDAGETVTVTVSDIPDGFAVADDGPGIPPEDRETVFEHGYSTDEDGTGFGLAIVKEIAEAHGWTVSVTDSDAGGARFEFTGVERPE